MVQLSQSFNILTFMVIKNTKMRELADISSLKGHNKKEMKE